MITLMVMMTVIILIFTCLFKVDFKFKMIPKEQRKEKGWLNINGKKIF